MRIQGAVIGVVLVGLLVGCSTQPQPETTVEPSPTPTPVTESAPVGEAAIPLGCSDLLTVADVADLGSTFDERLSLAVHENRIAVDMSVADLQLGTLKCSWAARYGATDFHASVDVRIAPSTATAPTPADLEWFAGPLAPLEADPTVFLACSGGFQADDTSTLFNGCAVLQFRAGYRIDLSTSGIRVVGDETGPTLDLLAEIGAAVDGAAPARRVEPVAGTTDPAALCTAPELTPVLERLAVSGTPSISPDPAYPGVTTCAWPRVDDYGSEIGSRVSVLPGGSWAIPRLGTGVASIFMPTHPSADGSFIIGVGDGVSAWRAIGDDLVVISSGDFEAIEGWEAFLEEIW